MRVRLLGWFLVAAFGCESLRTAPPPRREPPTSPPSAAVPTPAREAAVHLPPATPTAVEPERGPKAATAVPPERFPAPVTPVEPDFLALFSECLERDDLRGAARQLEAYVQRHPDQPLFRFQLATLYARCHCPHEARFHYECFARDAETQGQALQSQVITAHIQLLEMAQQRGDRFAELYHRGVGLWLLVRQQDNDPNRDAAFCEEILCKAYRALTEAKALKPNDPRIRTYLAAVQEAMGNRFAAAAEQAAVRSNPVCGELNGGKKSLE